MLNHARTLLMNVDGSAPMLEYLAEEIVDPSYVKLRLPVELQTLRAVMFGSEPDRHMLNYRCRQFITITHSTELSEYIYALDHRITYKRDWDTLLRQHWRPTVTRLAGATNDTLTIIGDSDPSDVNGRMFNSYLIAVTGTGEAEIQQTVAPFLQTFITFSVGEKLTLPGSALQFKLTNAASGQLYRIDEYLVPQTDLSKLTESMSRLGEPVYNYLFGVTRVEPFLTFRNLWFRKQELPLRLGALVCALVYRMDAIRNQSSSTTGS